MANLTDMMSKIMCLNTASSSGSGTLPGNTITNPKEELKGITTRRGVAYQGPTIPNPSKVVKQGTEVTKDQVQTVSSQSTTPVQPPVSQSETLTPIFEPVVAPVSAPMPNLKSSILYPSRRDNKRHPLIGNKEKLSEMARTPMNEHCSSVILNKLPRKLGDPGKFLIPCEFPGMDECLALAYLGASINLMPFSVWEALSLLELTPTCMTLELADRSVSKPIGIAKDVSFKTGRALIDVHKGELTLRIRNEAITYNLDQTVRYLANYNQMTANKIDVIEMAYEEYSQEVLGFCDVTTSGNPTLHDDPIASTTSPTLTPFGDSDFLLFKEADAFLGLEDDPDSPKINPFYYDPKGDILLLEAILNSKPLPPHPNREQYLPSFKKEQKVCEAKTVKSSIDEPPRVELKDLPPYLEYAFLEGDNKLPVIIAKELGDEETSALIKVLKPHKRAIAWKLSDIHGINPEFCTHKILMEEDNKPAVQHQRRVNPKIHNVVKKEVEKLLDAGLIYPISDSPWVSPVCIEYCKLNEATRKDHFLLPFMDQMLERLAGNEFYCFLDGFSGYFQIPIDPRDQEKTTFTCPYETFACRRIPFGLCNAPGTFQRFFGNSFENCLSRLDKMLQRAKVDVIAKLPHPIIVKECIKAFQTLRKKLTEAPILIAPNWDLPFELMCDASDFAIGAVLGQRHEKHFKPIHYASKTMNDVKSNYTTTEKEMLAVVYAFEKFWSHQIMNKSIVHTDHSALKYLYAKKDAKARLLRALCFADFANYHAGNFIVKVTHRLSIAYHPQTSRQVEVSNRGLKRILERTIGENRASWSDKLDDALWAFRTAYKTPIGCTPYKLVYGKACRLSIELEHKAYWALKQVNFDLVIAGDHRKIQLNELNEIRDHAYENSLIYKKKMKRIHDSKIKNRVFHVGDRVFLFNSRLKIFSGKIKTRWSGPFTIAKVFPYGTVELSQANGPNFKVNGHRVKHYFGVDVPQLDYLDCEVFRALSFSFTRASHPQLHLGNPVSKSYRLTFSFGLPNKWP
nr:reverse transcriptase domain-containing protein [Tanacetum cinerariifolium]